MWTPELRCKFDQALLALGRLDSVVLDHGLRRLAEGFPYLLTCH